MIWLIMKKFVNFGDVCIGNICQIFKKIYYTKAFISDIKYNVPESTRKHCKIAEVRWTAIVI